MSPFTWTDRTGRVLYLHGRWVTHAGGARQFLVYFSAKRRAESVLDALPPDYEVVVSPTNGRPYVHKRATAREGATD